MGTLKIEEKRDSWIFIVPVFGIELTKNVNDEIKINKTTFISKNKLIRVRKKFGIPERISSYKKSGFFDEKCDTLAIIRKTGKIEDITIELYKILDDELNILISAFYGFKRRDFFHKIGYYGDSKHSIFSHIFISSTTHNSWQHSMKASNILPLKMDDYWSDFQKKYHYFDNLLKIIHGKENKFQTLLKRISILIGRSFNSNDVVDAFLYNIIILEALLTNSDDKQKDTLILRLRAFFGWLNDWNKDTDQKIESLYKKRNSYIHTANSEAITINDLLFTDELIFNLLVNILKHPKYFPSKDSLITFSKKIEAEKILGIKSIVSPKTFSYLRIN